MKAVVIKIMKNSAYVLLENGKFATVAKKPYMKNGMQVYLSPSLTRRLTRVVNVAACFAAFVFAVVYLAYCLNIIMFH